MSAEWTVVKDKNRRRQKNWKIKDSVDIEEKLDTNLNNLQPIVKQPVGTVVKAVKEWGKIPKHVYCFGTGLLWESF